MKVSICGLTYNHEEYIFQMMNSLLEQQGVEFEVLIYDDASTDGTPGILQSYADKYPGKVIPVLGKTNIFGSTGQYPNIAEILYSQARGEYIALCEGDDYWNDPLKLHKQTSFMDKSPAYSMCHHDYEILENGKFRVPPGEPHDYTRAELVGMQLEGYGIATCTKLFRNKYQENKNAFEALYTDYPHTVLMGLYGECKYIKGVGPSVYRRLHGGSWTGLSQDDRHQKTQEMYIMIYNYFKANNNRKQADVRRKFF